MANATTDVELIIHAPPEFKSMWRALGIDEVRRALAFNFDSVRNQVPVIASVVTQGDTVVMMGRETGHIKATGEPYDVEFVHRFTFREGQLAAIRILAVSRIR